MKAIKLTEKHKSKLLEMCKELFPEYKPKLYKNKIGLWILNSKGLSEGEYLIKIHWFEFCMTHLANKIYYPDLDNISRTARDKIQNFFFSSFMEAIEGGPAGYDHPIDYLYEEFKKLK